MVPPAPPGQPSGARGPVSPFPVRAAAEPGWPPGTCLSGAPEEHLVPPDTLLLPRAGAAASSLPVRDPTQLCAGEKTPSAFGLQFPHLPLPERPPLCPFPGLRPPCPLRVWPAVHPHACPRCSPRHCPGAMDDELKLDSLPALQSSNFPPRFRVGVANGELRAMCEPCMMFVRDQE